MSTPESHRQTLGSQDESQQAQTQSARVLPVQPAEFADRTKASVPTSLQPVCDASHSSIPFAHAVTTAWSTHDGAHSSAPRSNPFPPLKIQTDLPLDRRPVSPLNDYDTCLRQSLSSTSLYRRTPSYSSHSMRKNTMSSTDSLSPSSMRSSNVSSPVLAALADITPLPSPIGYLSPASWRSGGRTISSHSLTRTSSTCSRSGSYFNLRLSDSNQLLRTVSSRSRSRRYSSTRLTGNELRDSGLDGHEEPQRHSRNRSLSEHIPQNANDSLRPPAHPSDQLSDSSIDTSTDPNQLHREQYLGVQRGLALSAARPPTPPRSTRNGDEEEEEEGEGEGDSKPIIHTETADGSQNETYLVRSIRTKQSRKYRKLRQLGQGTFSQVSLAVRIPDDAVGRDGHMRMPSLMSQKLVAVKIIEYGPAGGADEERVDVSLKREVEILKSVNHPSLVQLKAFGADDKRALLVLDYCPGGDLFDFATSDMKSLMTPPLIRRMFAEMVGAVRYLHAQFIVHRDIKLENVLVNLPPSAMGQISDWRTYDRAVITISDLGLSRRIPEPPESPLLHTRCGSEDYAAPEILMGQPYDGRSTDAWALGVLLYAMMENRLPFDALPGTRGDPAKLRARTPHRIARCEWSWFRYANEDEEWDPIRGQGLEGARDCVEGLLKRHSRRKSLDEIAKHPFVSEALDLDGELKRGDKEVP